MIIPKSAATDADFSQRWPPTKARFARCMARDANEPEHCTSTLASAISRRKSQRYLIADDLVNLLGDCPTCRLKAKLKVLTEA